MFIKGESSRFLTKNFWFKFFLLLILINFSFNSQSQEKKSGAEKIPSLIKINLLPKKDISFAPVLRDIFSPQVYSSPLPVSSSEKQSSGPGQVILGQQSEPEGETASSTGYRLSLRYIGYVHSIGKTIALIVFNGLAIPVEEGELITPEFQVVRITPEEIVIAGPDKEEFRFSLEGEKNEKI